MVFNVAAPPTPSGNACRPSGIGRCPPVACLLASTVRRSSMDAAQTTDPDGLPATGDAGEPSQPTPPWPSGQVGQVRLSPAAPVTAGEFATWTVRYEVGPYGMDDGGGLKLLFPIPSDRGVPQFTDPSAPNYTTVRTSGTARVRARYATKLHTRPWVKGIAVDVEDGPLAPGDTIEVVIGDTREGSPGATAQSYCEPESTIRVVVDPFATNVYYGVPGQTAHAVVAGPATALVATAPSQATGGEPIVVSVRAIDRYGNVATGACDPVTISAGAAVLASGNLGDG